MDWATKSKAVVGLQMAKRHKYYKKEDTLWVSVDESERGAKINRVVAIKNYFYFDMNPRTGAIRSFEIKHFNDLINQNKKSPNIYSEQETASIRFYLVDDGYEQTGADCVFFDKTQNAMITIDRNEVGNIQGVEIINTNYFLT